MYTINYTYFITFLKTVKSSFLSHRRRNYFFYIITVKEVVVQKIMNPNQKEYQEQNRGGMNPTFMSTQEIGPE